MTSSLTPSSITSTLDRRTLPTSPAMLTFDSPSSSRSSKKTCHFALGTPALSINTTNHSHLPTPPLTPLTPLTPCLRTSTHMDGFYPLQTNAIQITPISPPAPVSPLAKHHSVSIQTAPSSVPVPYGIPIPTPYDADHHLHSPLCAHLALLHPSTPREIIHFCATRLLSPERPFGLDRHDSEDGEAISGQDVKRYASRCWDKIDGEEGELEEEEWTPLWAGIGDLATAGLGLEAAKGCEQIGPGRQADERLEWMYGAARRSWELLERRSPTSGNRL